MADSIKNMLYNQTALPYCYTMLCTNENGYKQLVLAFENGWT